MSEDLRKCESVDSFKKKLQGPVVQIWFSVNPGLKLIPLF